MEVLMPCRALEAFRRKRPVGSRGEDQMQLVLMPCRALEAFRRLPAGEVPPAGGERLNALSGIGGVQTDLVPVEQAGPVRSS